MLVLNFKIKLETVEIFCNTKNVTISILKEGDVVTVGLSLWYQPPKPRIMKNYRGDKESEDSF